MKDLKFSEAAQSPTISSSVLLELQQALPRVSLGPCGNTFCVRGVASALPDQGSLDLKVLNGQQRLLWGQSTAQRKCLCKTVGSFPAQSPRYAHHSHKQTKTDFCWPSPSGNSASNLAATCWFETLNFVFPSAVWCRATKIWASLNTSGLGLVQNLVVRCFVVVVCGLWKSGLCLLFLGFCTWTFCMKPIWAFLGTEKLVWHVSRLVEWFFARLDL